VPAAVRILHDGVTRAEGRAKVERGGSWLSRLAGMLFAFPEAGTDVPLSVDFELSPQGETWTRRFGVRSFSSRQFLGTGRWERLLCESFGPLTFAMALVLEDGRMHLALRGWSAFGLPMPMWLCARSASYEEGDDRFRFHVEISHPLTGLIVRYQGWLAPASRLASEPPSA
jgi:hypothetical protein